MDIAVFGDVAIQFAIEVELLCNECEGESLVKPSTVNALMKHYLWLITLQNKDNHCPIGGTW